ncbi:hypothetical protein AUEXF2481DRAFT_176859 [Aureobasidium subglaciale EXF-2481]|uniref:Zn(2)-C6 fungal-type domain-containing protein n=1 Tax=Aureobasidium subglaciale (strain EXF-2481) TaxID=1043005 RepID=A0A074ZM23_AURSE|nr:uncharacterized protein AUEXF2481DRAFT_176859 [Aureobasidium subglaciale EXF-2481]KEQ99441.1 hypothetical protein AUEXF2481DRAFT_176859 [Aureobasidium subglaciale EXF-2481]
MVYGGKPSRGCGTCKKRKIKCDEGRPTCTQCEKSSRICLGYKDEADYIFRNQTDKVTSKVAKTRKPRKSGSPDSTYSKDSVVALPKSAASELPADLTILPISSLHNQLIRTRGSLQTNLEALTTLCQQPTVSVEEEVVNVYFRNFVRLYRTQDTVREFLPFLAPMYGASSKDSLLRTATHAAALCAISQLPEQRHLQYRAADTYGKAMRIAASALQDPAQATSDETLQATLLMCLYESIKATDNSINAWSNHVEGASAIVQSRGTKQIETQQSLALFRAARTHMLINCIRQGKPTKQLESGMIWLCDNTEDDPLAYLTHCTIELPALMEKTRRLCERERDPNSMADMEDILERACHLEATMQNWVASLSDDWLPHTIAYIPEKPVNPLTADAWVGPVHAFSDVHKGCVLNKLHSCHMLSAAVILNGLEWLRPYDYPMDDRYIHTRWIEQRTVDDICSSVPFYLGMGQQRARTPDQMETIADLIGGYSLIWPLHAAASCPRISKDQWLYIYGRLAKIAKECGLQQALLISTDRKDQFVSPV